MSVNKKHAIIILGMHRSGTSAFAGCLNQLGITMGNVLLPGDDNNELGYFEHADIVLTHDILFNKLGYRWDMVGNLPQNWLNSEGAIWAKQSLLSIVSREFKHSHLWGVKDPRMCRLMPLWFDILTELDVFPKFVLIVRHPFEVACSLAKRNNIDLLTGHLLWMTHVREALAACRGHDHVILTYDQLLADPVGSIKSTGHSLDVVWPQTQGLPYREILNFIRPELKHHHPTKEACDQERFTHFSMLYDQLKTQQASASTDNIEPPGFSFPEASDSVPTHRLNQHQGNSISSVVDTKSDKISEGNTVTSGQEFIHYLLELIGKYEQKEFSRNVSLENTLAAAQIQSRGGYLFAQIFFPQIHNHSDYSEEQSSRALLVPDVWQKIVFEVPDAKALQHKRLRFDPISSIGTVSISGISLINPADRQTLWTAAAGNGFFGCELVGDGLLISNTETLVLVSIGSDPQLLLPIIPNLQDVPLHLEVWIKVARDLKLLAENWKTKELTLIDQTNNLGQMHSLLKKAEEANQRIKALEGELAEKTILIESLKQEQTTIKKQGELRVEELQVLLEQQSQMPAKQVENLP